MNTELVRYNEMCRAIAECHAVDEVKEIRDKAMALEHYAKQAMNMEAERQACEVRLRAERKAGEMLREQEGKGSHGGNRKSSSSVRLEDLHISKTQSSRWQALAAVPEEDFEQALTGEEKPSTTGIIRRAASEPAMDPDALWLWGRMRDFERMGLAGRDLHALLGSMTDTMRSDMERILPTLKEWIDDAELDARADSATAA